MRKLSKEAFATMGVCSKCRKPFGITVDRADTRHNEYVFVWAFKVNTEQAHREGYDTKSVHGSIALDDEYPAVCIARNAEALCVDMEKDFLDAGKYGEVMEFSGSDRNRQTFGESSSIVGYCV